MHSLIIQMHLRKTILFIQASKSYSRVSIFPFILMITYSPPYFPTQDCTIDHLL